MAAYDWMMFFFYCKIDMTQSDFVLDILNYTSLD